MRTTFPLGSVNGRSKRGDLATESGWRCACRCTMRIEPQPPATWISVAWEVLFTPLVMCRWTRKWALWFGVLFHMGIYLTIEVGWFGFYTMSLYGVWIPGEFWDRWRKPTPGVSADTENSGE